MKLKKDIVIPKGTILQQVEKATFYQPYEVLVPLTKDSVGWLLIPFDQLDKDISEWVEEVE